MDEEHPLTAARRHKNMTQQQLADQVGVRQSTISQLETRRRGATLELALKLREIFGVFFPIESVMKGGDHAG